MFQRTNTLLRNRKKKVSEHRLWMKDKMSVITSSMFVFFCKHRSRNSNILNMQVRKKNVQIIPTRQGETKSVQSLKIASNEVVKTMKYIKLQNLFLLSGIYNLLQINFRGKFFTHSITKQGSSGHKPLFLIQEIKYLLKSQCKQTLDFPFMKPE